MSVEMEKVVTQDDIPVMDVETKELSDLLEALVGGGSDEFHTSDTGVVTVGYAELCEMQDALTRVDVLEGIVKRLKGSGAETINIELVSDVLGMTRL